MTICKKPGFNPWVRKSPWRRKWQPAPVLLPGNFTDRGSWWATVHGGHKESDTSDHTEENTSEIEGPEIDIQNEAQRQNTFKGMNRRGCETIPSIKNTYQKEMRERKGKHT